MVNISKSTILPTLFGCYIICKIQLYTNFQHVTKWSIMAELQTFKGCVSIKRQLIWLKFFKALVTRYVHTAKTQYIWIAYSSKKVYRYADTSSVKLMINSADSLHLKLNQSPLPPPPPPPNLIRLNFYKAGKKTCW